MPNPVYLNIMVVVYNRKEPNTLDRRVISLIPFTVTKDEGSPQIVTLVAISFVRVGDYSEDDVRKVSALP
jgi:hypothetical protein